MSKKTTQNTKPEGVEVEKAEVEAVEPPIEPVVEVEKVPFWKRPKVQKVGKIAAVIAAIGGAAVAGVMLGKKTASDDGNLTEDDYIDMLHTCIEDAQESDRFSVFTPAGEPEQDTTP